MRNLHYRGRLFHSRLSHTLTLFCFIFFGTALSLSAQQTDDLWYTKNDAIKIDGDNTGSQNTILFGSKISRDGIIYLPMANRNRVGYINATYSNLRDWYPGAIKSQEYVRDFERMDFGYFNEFGAPNDSFTYYNLMSILQNGNVGIGTTSPGVKLDVVGRIRSKSGSDTPGIAFTNSTNTADRGFVGMKDDNTIGFNGTVSGWGLIMNVNTGNVGIGTTTPAALLDIRGGADSDGANSSFPIAIQWHSGGYRHWITTRHHGVNTRSTGNSIDFYLNNSTGPEEAASPHVGTVHGMSVTANGVGIGTSEPEQKLHVDGTIQATGFKLPTGAGSGKVLVSDSQGIGTWQTNTNASGWLLSGTSTTTTNKIGIATTTPAALLDIRGGARSDGTYGDNGIAFQRKEEGGYRHWITTRHNATSTPSTGNAIDFYLNNSTTSSGSASPLIGAVHAMSITTKGVGIATTTPAAVLDIQGGANDDGTKGKGLIAFQHWYYGGFRHWIATRHKDSSEPTNGNAIDFYINNSSTIEGSSAPGNGSEHRMSITSFGVGIGTENPEARLDVRGSGFFSPAGTTGPKVVITVNKTKTAGWIGTLNKYDLYIGTNNSPQIYLDTTDNVFIGFAGVDIPAAPNARNKFDLFVHRGILTEDYALAPKSSWSDYVFEDNYPLEKLSEVEAYIKKNKHLPNIPSQAEVAKEGYSVHDMTRKFLEKIEELTLHAINQEKEITQLKQQLRGYESLTSDIQALKAQLDKK